jgi:phosphoesterase RecJ-like protein
MMELSPKQQAIELVRSADRVLVLTHIDPDGDAIGSLLALTLTLRKLKKTVMAAVAGNVPTAMSFLPSLDSIAHQITGGKEFTISIDTSEVEVEKLGYKTLPEEKKLNVVVTTKNGVLEPRHVTLGTSLTPYDLIIVLDAPDLDRLGDLYDKDPELFYNVPVINIDHHPSNEYYGKVNWVDVTATSTAEILVSLIEALGSSGHGDEMPQTTLVDPDIATALLTGITTDTGSFQNTNTTPKSLTIAAQLVGSGARQQEIIRHIFKTKPLTTLRLWGKALTHITSVPLGRFVYSTLSAADYHEAGAKSDESSGVVDELMKSAPGIDFVMLIVERNGGVHGSLRATDKSVDVSTVARIFGGGGHEMAAAYHLENTTLEREKKRIITKITDYQMKRLAMADNQSAMPTLDEDHLPTSVETNRLESKPKETSSRPVEAGQMAKVVTHDANLPAGSDQGTIPPEDSASKNGSSKW